MNTAKRHCPYCRTWFVPSCFRPGQRICSRPQCQRRRKREYHQQKVIADPEYRQACRDSRQKWQAQNPDYQSRYRKTHPHYVEQNRERQRRRDQKRPCGSSCKEQLSFGLKAFTGRGLAHWPRGGRSCKEQLGFFRSSGFSAGCHPIGSRRLIL